jgi:hypothetical protein
MKFLDVQQVCLNGHQITASYERQPENRRDFCNKCGALTIFKCPECGHPIKGKLYREHVLSSYTPPVPSHCDGCGKAYPWAQSSTDIEEAVSERTNPLVLVENICNRFHLVAEQLRTRHKNRESLYIGDEYDVQYLLHALLLIHFDDIRPEEWAPSSAGSASRVDFLLKTEKIVVEAKKTRESLKAKQLGEQLIIDIERYRAHQGCKTLVCFVYDPEGWISNPRGLENDLNREENGFVVKVLIVP